MELLERLLPCRRRNKENPIILIFKFSFLFSIFASVRTQCPFPSNMTDLHAKCLCAYTVGKQLSVQCTQVSTTRVFETLKETGKYIPIDLLYINNSSLAVVEADSFNGLQITTLQLSGCRIQNISAEAFRGLEKSLSNLHLQENELNEVPTTALRRLKSLQLLDLSRNKLTVVQDKVFDGLRI